MSVIDSKFIKALGIDRFNQLATEAVSQGYSPQGDIIVINDGQYGMVMVADTGVTVTDCKAVMADGFDRLAEMLKSEAANGYAPQSGIIPAGGNRWVSALVKGRQVQSGGPVDAAGLMAKRDIDGVASFAALRARQPAYEGERVYLKCHTTGDFGGGFFIGRMRAQADDGGYVASSGKAWHWERDKKLSQLCVDDFGAVPDGVTDSQPAFKANLEFLNSNYAKLKTGGKQSGSNVNGGYSPSLAIRFNEGTYYVSPGEYNKYGAKLADGDATIKIFKSGYKEMPNIRIEGVRVDTMKQVVTRIISDKSDKTVFLLNHRRMTVHGIIWDGQQTTPQNVYNADTNPTGQNLLQGATLGVFNDTASNKQTFMKNECPGGLYGRVSCINAINTGGPTFDIIDTLDSLFDNIFGQRTAAPVIQVGWSDPLNEFYGAWDHSTSLEIRNCNFLSNAAPVIWAPRCQQAVMHNVWVSGPAAMPIDINNGQWTITMLVVEGARQNPTFWNCKDTINIYSAATGNGIDRFAPDSGKWNSYPTNPDGSAITGWNNGYDLGTWQLQNHTVNFDCAVVSKFERGVLRGTNNTDSVLWVNVGKFTNPTNGGSWRIRVQGGRFYNTEAKQNPVTDSTYGQTVIDIGRSVSTTPKANWYSEGSGPIIANPQWQTQQYVGDLPALWIPIRSRCGEFSISVEATGLTRQEAGIPCMFYPSGETRTTSPNTGNEVEPRFAFHNGKAGIGAQGDIVGIFTRSEASSQTPVEQSKPRQWMRMNINGKDFAVPYYAYNPVITTQPAGTVNLASGANLSLSVVAKDAASYTWQKSTDSGATWNNITGATAATYSKTGVTAADAGQYRCIVKGELGAIDAATTTNQVTTNVSTVNVT